LRIAANPSNPVTDLYADHHGWLQGWLRRKLGCAQHAADLAQDTFVRILGMRLEKLNEVQEPRAYLTTVARGLVIDHYRRRELEQAYLQSLAHLPEAVALSPEHRQLALEALMAVDRLLDGLSPKARAAWLHSRLDGLTHGEIAGLLGVSVPRVRQYLATAARQCYALRFGLKD
jgi:RNA polymerase sigma factor (sigma-70 family)